MGNDAHQHLLVNHLPIFAAFLSIPMLVMTLLLRKERGLLLASVFLLVAAGLGGWLSYASGEKAWDMIASAQGETSPPAWTDAVLDRVPGVEGPRSFFDNAPPALSTTRDTVSLNVGLEHLVLREGSVVPLRLGFGWEPQGGTDPFTRDPVDYLLMSAGAGYNTNRFKFDAAVQYRRGSFRVSDVYSVQTELLGSGPDAIGLASTREWRIKVSAIYRLADTDALRKAIRRILG